MRRGMPDRYGTIKRAEHTIGSGIFTARDERRGAIMFKLKFLVAIFFAASLSLAGVRAALAESMWQEAGLGVASVLGSAFYSPVKVYYAALGAVTGGVAWVVTGGNTELAQKIWQPALGGDYVITPQVFRGAESSPKP